jgi:diketogulonate reductase-like aldo/keto reductase
VRHLGISNAPVHFVQELHSLVNVRPTVVQSRFRLVRSEYQESYDFGLRELCRKKGIIYQPFWVLKANPHLLKANIVASLAAHFEVSCEQMLYALVASLGDSVAILNGTTSRANMVEDIAALKTIGCVPAPVTEAFEHILRQFASALDKQ